MTDPVLWSAEATEFAAFRLPPGADLRSGIEEVFAASEASAGFVVTCVGSLFHGNLRFADRRGASRVNGPLEIVGLTGTFGPDGAHLHLTISDAEGRVTAGHLLQGSRIRTTAEVVLGLSSAVVFARALDRMTGSAELVVDPASD